MSPTAETTFLYLVRHGATDANNQRPPLLQGRGIDKPLNAAGRHQAAAVASFLSNVKLGCVYSSPLVRAMQTAGAIAARHTLAVRAVDEIAECDVGRWEGLDWGSIERRYPEAYAAFTDNPADVAYLDGESYGDVLRRTAPALTSLLRRHVGQAIAVVAHNVVNRVYLANLLGLDLPKAKDLRQANCCVNVVRYHDNATTLVTMNAEFHLEGAWQRPQLERAEGASQRFAAPTI